MKPAIITPAISVWVEETRAMIAAASEEEAQLKALEIRLGESRDRLKARHLELGRQLAKVHGAMPKRSKAGQGWMAFLEAIEMNPSTAYRYMQEAGWISDRPLIPNLGNNDTQPADVPAPTDHDRPPENTAERDEDGARVQAAEPAAEPVIEIDRNTWCTAKEWAERLGSWDLDPCSNARSHIRAARDLRLDERGEDGLFFANKFGPETRAFINPPYARGQVLQWVQAYAHTRFCFLLKFDPSTEWFGELMRHTGVVMIPKGERIEFEPPPGIPPEKAAGVQFPHAFFYARSEDITDEMRRACFPAWRIR